MTKFKHQCAVMSMYTKWPLHNRNSICLIRYPLDKIYFILSPSHSGTFQFVLCDQELYNDIYHSHLQTCRPEFTLDLHSVCPFGLFQGYRILQNFHFTSLTTTAVAHGTRFNLICCTYTSAFRHKAWCKGLRPLMKMYFALFSIFLQFFVF